MDSNLTVKTTGCSDRLGVDQPLLCSMEKRVGIVVLQPLPVIVDLWKLPTQGCYDKRETGVEMPETCDPNPVSVAWVPVWGTGGLGLSVSAYTNGAVVGYLEKK